MGERGRELALSHYKWNRVASEVLTVWDQAVSVSTAETSMELASSQPKSAETISSTTDRIDQPTQRPVPTIIPNVVERPPVPTITPNVIERPPVPTVTPNVAGKPVPTIIPNVAGKPVPTVTPNVIEKPVPTVTPNVIEKPVPTITPNVAEKSAATKNQKAMEDKKQVAGLTRSHLDELIIAHHMLMRAKNKKNNQSNGTMNGSANRNNRNNRNRELLNMLLRQWGKNA